MAKKAHDPERQRRIDAQADKVAELLGIDPESVMTDGNYGVSLTPDQMDKLFIALITQGWKNAAVTLREAADQARESGQAPGRVGAFATGASFLNNQVTLAEQAKTWSSDHGC